MKFLFLLILLIISSCTVPLDNSNTGLIGNGMDTNMISYNASIEDINTGVEVSSEKDEKLQVTLEKTLAYGNNPNRFKITYYQPDACMQRHVKAAVYIDKEEKSMSIWFNTFTDNNETICTETPTTRLETYFTVRDLYYERENTINYLEDSKGKITIDIDTRNNESLALYSEAQTVIQDFVLKIIMEPCENEFTECVKYMDL